jgi:hypothetical protein
MLTTETRRIRVYFYNLAGKPVSTVHAVTLTTNHDLVKFMDEAIKRTCEREDFRGREDCDCHEDI